MWPISIAPYDVQIVPLQVKNPEVMEFATRLHAQLTNVGLDVLTDDRDHQTGVKFKDADLIGIPLRVVIGEKNLKNGQVEVKWRRDPKEAAKLVRADQATDEILSLYDAARKAHNAKCSQEAQKRAEAKANLKAVKK